MAPEVLDITYKAHKKIHRALKMVPGALEIAPILNALALENKP